MELSHYCGVPLNVMFPALYRQILDYILDDEEPSWITEWPGPITTGNPGTITIRDTRLHLAVA